MRHRRDDVNIRLRDSRVNHLRVIDRLPTIAQLPKTCRAEASSMPAGPAAGRVEAQRRALTTQGWSAGTLMPDGTYLAVRTPRLRLRLGVRDAGGDQIAQL